MGMDGSICNRACRQEFIGASMTACGQEFIEALMGGVGEGVGGGLVGNPKVL